jgi:hypothetical protein
MELSGTLVNSAFLPSFLPSFLPLQPDYIAHLCLLPVGFPFLFRPVDNQGLCPSDISLSLNSPKCYTTITSHAARSEFLLGVLADKKKADSMDEAGEGEEADAADGHLILKDGEKDTTAGSTDLFLKSKLTYLSDDDGRERVVDEEVSLLSFRQFVQKLTSDIFNAQGNGVMVSEGV